MATKSEPFLHLYVEAFGAAQSSQSSQTESVPEPSTPVLFDPGLLGLAGAARQKLSR